LAQSPIDVPTLITIAPQEEALSTGAPRSSFDYETARTATPARPWETSRAPWNAEPGSAQPSAIASAAAPSAPTAFTGAAPPLACRLAGHIIIDKSGDMRAGMLCVLPDGSWRLIP
jgi:hypothetical protein